MGQEFIIKSQNLEDKINQLLPSQGGFQAGVDLSASTTIIPIVDLTESAEGSDVRQDLQTALSFNSSTAFNANNQTVTIINTTGYWRIIGTSTLASLNGADSINQFDINDGVTDKTIYIHRVFGSSATTTTSVSFDFVVFLTAGDSLKVTSNREAADIGGSFRQIADISGNLVNP
jgi:hypothetical protein